MSIPQVFTDEQKQYLQGFMTGALQRGVARGPQRRPPERGRALAEPGGGLGAARRAGGDERFHGGDVGAPG